MNVLLKSAIIIDASSKHHLKKRDILIENGVISKIAASISKETVKEVILDNLHISSGWFDPSVSFGEPGFEERETITNGLKTAALSGFTHVAINTNTNPVADTKSTIQYIKTRGGSLPTTLYPIGALTKKCDGVDLAELFDMQNEGAIAFYDYKKPIANANLLKIALQYTQNFEGLVQSFPMDTSVSPKGIVHEDVASTLLGLKGIPSLAEELQITRDLYLLEYTGGKLHIPTISTAKSVELIKAAKKKGLHVSCSVSINNLGLTDEVLETFDTTYKVMPPLRTKNDAKALLKGLKDGVIDGVTSDHNPIDIENKKVEFDHAMYGSIGLESCFGILNKLVDLEIVIQSFQKLKSTFGIPIRSISEGDVADITLFNPKGSKSFSEKDILSTSKNAAMLGQNIEGEVYGVFANKKLQVR